MLPEAETGIPGPRKSWAQWLWLRRDHPFYFCSPLSKLGEPEAEKLHGHTHANSWEDAQLALVQASVLHLPQKRGGGQQSWGRRTEAAYVLAKKTLGGKGKPGPYRMQVTEAACWSFMLFLRSRMLSEDW